MMLQDLRLDFYITKARQVQALGRAGCEPNFERMGGTENAWAIDSIRRQTPESVTGGYFG